VSGAADRVTPTPAAAPTRGADAGGARFLLVVVEPRKEERGAGEATAAGSAALFAEGARLGRALGAEPRFVTWRAGVEIDPEVVATLLAAFVERSKPVTVVMADTDVCRELAPLLAARLGSGAVVGCSDLRVRGGAPVFVKPVYGGWLEQEIEPIAGTVPVATLDLTGVDEADSFADGLPIPEVLEIEGPAQGAPGAPQLRPRVRHLETIPPDPRTVDLTHAKRIVAAGSGSSSEDLLAAARELADLLAGSVGATRPVVDDGRLPKERLIGQTGKTVTPGLYLALGISGSPHHMAGVQNADRILSINRDVRAPIFRFSDVGYVADLEAVLPALVSKIKEWRDAPVRPEEPR
jgi:electron transfer flavoprotein alpha subunit